MTASDWKNLLEYILKNFEVHYDDFRKEAYTPYRKRRIVGFIRFDQKAIFFDQNIRGKMEELTWAHEALSIYYYVILKVIRHDDEIEEEDRALCDNASLTRILRMHIDLARSRHSNSPDS